MPKFKQYILLPLTSKGNSSICISSLNSVFSFEFICTYKTYWIYIYSPSVLQSPSYHFHQQLSNLSSPHTSKTSGYSYHSVQSGCSVWSNSSWPHGLQHARFPCPSPTPRACSNSCPSSRWCYPTISSSVVPFSFCLQSFPASGSFSTSHLYS